MGRADRIHYPVTCFLWFQRNANRALVTSLRNPTQGALSGFALRRIAAPFAEVVQWTRDDCWRLDFC